MTMAHGSPGRSRRAYASTASPAQDTHVPDRNPAWIAYQPIGLAWMTRSPSSSGEYHCLYGGMNAPSVASDPPASRSQPAVRIRCAITMWISDSDCELIISLRFAVVSVDGGPRGRVTYGHSLVVGGSRLPRVHHVGPQHVLASLRDGRAFVQLQVREHQCHSALRSYAETKRSVFVVELRFAAGEVVVQVQHEREVTTLDLASAEISIVVEPEFLARIVAIEAEPLVQAREAASFRRRRQRRARSIT